MPGGGLRRACFFAQAKAITSGNPLVLEKAVADQELVRLSRLDRAYNRNMIAVAHTKSGEQSAADAATADLPLIQAAAARTLDTTADAFKAGIDGKTGTGSVQPSCGVEMTTLRRQLHVRARCSDDCRSIEIIWTTRPVAD